MTFRKPFKPAFKSPLGDFQQQFDLGASSLARPPKSPIPEPNPFRVGLESNPVPRPVSPVAASYYGDALKLAQNATGIAVNVAADEAKEKVVGAVLGKTVATAIGVVAVPFVAADLFEVLAPGVKSWLMGGWATGAGVQPAGRRSILFNGQGACPTSYTVTVSFTLIDGGGSGGSSSTTIQGPIKSLALGIGPDSFGNPRHYLYYQGATDPSVVGKNMGLNPSAFSATVTSFVRDDGSTVKCSPTLLGPDPVTSSPRPVRSRQTPQDSKSPFPPSQRTVGNLPSTQRLSELFRPPAGKGSPAPVPGNPKGLNPSSQTDSSAESYPDSVTYSPPPRNPVPPFSEEDGCNPCLLKIGRKLEEIEEKLEEDRQPDEETEETTCETYPFEYSYGVCDNGEFKIEPRTLMLSQKPTASLRAEFDAMLVAAAQNCGKDAIAAIPDWWQVRIGAERGQIVVVYRKGATATYHQICLPHPNDVTQWTSNLLGDYQKGSFQGILTLKDNSKFIINCISEPEALRMIARAKALIKPEMILSPSPEVVSRRRGAAVSDGSMYGRSAMYFSKGQKDARPDWRATFSP